METKPRNGASIDKLVVHDSEGPEDDHSAQGLAGYLQHIPGGYHALVDNVETIVTASDDTIVEGAGGMNTHGLHVCFVGYASQTRDGWLDAYSRGELHQAAMWVAAKCLLYRIPCVHLTPNQVRTEGVKGICGHGDVTAAGFTASEGHTDPGAGFPWDLFIADVQSILEPKPKVIPMYYPPLAVAASLPDRQGGIWLARPDGTVLHIDQDGTQVEGGMTSKEDRVAFGDRRVASLVFRWYRPKGKLIKRPGYRILTTDGNKIGYIPSNQH